MGKVLTLKSVTEPVDSVAACSVKDVSFSAAGVRQRDRDPWKGFMSKTRAVSKVSSNVASSDT